MSKEGKSLRGAQATAQNKRNYAMYVERLAATNQQFPSNQFGTVNLEAVAEQVGCTTKVLLTGSLRDHFNRDVQEIGVGPKKTPDSKLAEKAEAKTREVTQLLKQLNLKIKECESLSAENERLTRKVRELEMRREEKDLSLHELLKTGRRFAL